MPIRALDQKADPAYGGVVRLSRFQLALAVAAVAHAATWRVRPAPRPPLPVALAELAPSELSFDIDVAAEPLPATGRGTLAPSTTGRGDSRPSRAGAVRGGTVGPTDQVESVPASPADSAVAGLWNVDPSTQRDIGIRGPRTFATSPPPPSDSEMLRNRAQRAIDDSLRDGELTSVDTTTGPISHALTDSTRQSIAPVNGRATFDVVIDAGGVLLSIGTVDATSNRAAWEDVAKASAGSLAGRKLRTSKRGLVIRIEIASRELLPSGASGGIGGDVLSDGSGPPHAVDVHVLPIAPGHDGAWGKKDGEFTPLTGSFDVSDIGAHGQRVVGARVASVRDL